ncbi:hypothetical protein GOC90_25260 [Sinorhizobium medicae]|nr:hypothetical protein [Sinorhizobium medicae]MDX0647841.1 hypothetical protein [Sinorhizobium medicae]MDX0759419.1 hypothetical protein [Sinorhizobium medicae]MDX0796095.1 hypothetical protein [Sinorhizobium medicae]MDX1028884.1 hypothetical protein [Sinorhizobium medicae]
MADRPILFSAPMVRALFDDRKTQTRRIIKPQPFASGYYDGEIEINVIPANDQYPKAFRFNANAVGGGAILEEVFEPRINAGDRLWARETWQGLSFGDYQPTKSSLCEVRYAATDPCADLDAEARGYPWRPSIFMPRWASRLTLIVTDVRVERLQDISDADSIAEGVEQSAKFPGRYLTPAGDYAVPKVAYQRLWENINGKGAWDANPWVAAYTFTVIKQNVDQIKKVAA